MCGLSSKHQIRETSVRVSSLTRLARSACRRQSGFRSAREWSEWSRARNPYNDVSAYVLPIGFKQSPLLASLALWRSAVASSIEEAVDRGVLVLVYFDDFIGSSNDENELRTTYAGILAACEQANLVANEAKLIEPANLSSRSIATSPASRPTSPRNAFRSSST